MDILEALADETPPSGRRTCKIGRWLDTIPPDIDGYEKLVAAINVADVTNPDYRTLQQATRIASKLGLSTVYTTIGNHRAGRCRCFD